MYPLFFIKDKYPEHDFKRLLVCIWRPRTLSTILNTFCISSIEQDCSFLSTERNMVLFDPPCLFDSFTYPAVKLHLINFYYIITWYGLNYVALCKVDQIKYPMQSNNHLYKSIIWFIIVCRPLFLLVYCYTATLTDTLVSENFLVSYTSETIGCVCEPLSKDAETPAVRLW